MKLKVALLVIFFGILLTTVHCQQKYPSCLNDLARNIVTQHKNNPCDGSGKLLQIEQYSYKDTLLYKLIFEKKLNCLDYMSSTTFYTADCKIRFVIPGSSLLQKRLGSHASANEMRIKFIRSIDWAKDDKQQNNSFNGTLLVVDEKGNKLKNFYLSLNVENLWIAGSHINWETGVADKPDATTGTHTHCSAFVASTCKQIGIYILRPPEHGQILLANAQYDWLKTTDGYKAGWHQITGDNRKSIYINAQKLANSGNVIVAIIKSSDASRPGHAALVMPKEIDSNNLVETGPSLIMAGKHNFNLISLKNGFKSHLTGWPENEILFFVYNDVTLQIPSTNSN